MDIEKKEKLFLEKALRFWKSKGLIDDQQSEKMLASLRVISYDKQGLIRMLFWVSALSMLGAFASFLTIKPIMQWIGSLLVLCILQYLQLLPTHVFSLPLGCPHDTPSKVGRLNRFIF